MSSFATSKMENKTSGDVLAKLIPAQQGALRMEIWKDIVGYEGVYKVSNLGNITRNDKKIKKCLKTHTMPCRYPTISLSKDGVIKTKTVHRLVAKAFIPNPENKPCINHKDGDKKNNSVENLEWCTYVENISCSRRLGLLSNKNIAIRKLKNSAIYDIRSRKKSLHWYSKKYDIAIHSIFLIAHNKTYKEV